MEEDVTKKLGAINLLLNTCQPGTPVSGTSLVAQRVKNLPALWETWVRSLGWEDPLEEGVANPLQYSCLENPHGQRGLVGYSPWGWKETYMTERLGTARLPL